MSIKVYVAGKVSKKSVFGRHHWREEFCQKVSELSGKDIICIDPTKTNIQQDDTSTVFGADAYMISIADIVIVYLSDDISIGGSQEMLIAKYFKKPLIGLAPWKGKFYGSDREYYGKIYKNYKNPFVFSVCDVVCKDINEVSNVVNNWKDIKPKTIELIDEYISDFKTHELDKNPYIKKVGNI